MTVTRNSSNPGRTCARGRAEGLAEVDLAAACPEAAQHLALAAGETEVALIWLKTAGLADEHELLVGQRVDDPMVCLRDLVLAQDVHHAAIVVLPGATGSTRAGVSAGRAAVPGGVFRRAWREQRADPLPGDAEQLPYALLAEALVSQCSSLGSAERRPGVGEPGEDMADPLNDQGPRGMGHEL